jgi:hypothetical protein
VNFDVLGSLVDTIRQRQGLLPLQEEVLPAQKPGLGTDAIACPECVTTTEAPLEPSSYQSCSDPEMPNAAQLPKNCVKDTLEPSEASRIASVSSGASGTECSPAGQAVGASESLIEADGTVDRAASRPSDAMTAENLKDSIGQKAGAGELGKTHVGSVGEADAASEAVGAGAVKILEALASLSMHGSAGAGASDDPTDGGGGKKGGDAGEEEARGGDEHQRITLVRTKPVFFWNVHPRNAL